MALLSVAAAFLSFRAFGGQSLLHPGRIYAVLFAVHLAVPSVLTSLGLAPPFVNAANEPHIVSALVFAWICLAATTAGAWSASRLRLRPKNASAGPTYRWRHGRLLLAVCGLMLAAWITRIYVIQAGGYFQLQRATQGELEGPLYAAVRMVEQFGLFAVVMLTAYTWQPGQAPRPAMVRAVVLLALAEFLYWLPSGRKEDTILAILLPIATRYLLTGWRPSSASLGAFAVFIALLFPLSHYYRIAIELNLTSLSASEAMSLIELATSSASSAEVDIRPSDVIFNRISLLEPLAAAIRLVESGHWPLMLGLSYAEVLLTVVPRILWPGKPDFHYGNDFGHAAGFLAVGDDVTSISVTYFGEAFLNLGWLGALAMFVIAFIFGLLFKWARSSRDPLTGTVIFMLCLPSLLYLGGTFALYFGGLLKLLPFYYLVCSWIRTRGYS